MPEGWEWDPSLFEGSAPYYVQGRLPYPPDLADAFARPPCSTDRRGS